MNMNRPDKYAPLYVFAALISVCITLCIIAADSKGAITTDRECFSMVEWGPAPDGIRPCVTLRGNAPEGGAVRFKVTDASDVVRYTGYANTPYRRIIHVRVVQVYEDGSFTWKARSQDGRTYTANVGNLED